MMQSFLRSGMPEILLICIGMAVSGFFWQIIKNKRR